MKVEASVPSGSRTASARFCVTAAPPASTRIAVGAKVGGWFVVALMRTGSDSEALSALASEASPSATWIRNAELPPKVAVAVSVSCVEESATTESRPVWGTGEVPSTRRGLRPERVTT